jgi:c-di-AMP phosphodiesterase-like protein
VRRISRRPVGLVPACLLWPLGGALCLIIGRYDPAIACFAAAGSLLYIGIVLLGRPAWLGALLPNRPAADLARLIRRAGPVLLVGHANPDLDSLGAAFGLIAFAGALGKEAGLVTESPEQLRRQLAAADIPRGISSRCLISPTDVRQIADAASLLILVDTNKMALVEYPGLLAKAGHLAVIDHHPPSPGEIEGVELAYLDSTASSACEMVAEIIRSSATHIAPWEATLLLAGIALDTKNFSIQTRVRTFAVAAFLRRCGADPLRVRDLLRDDIANFAKRLEILRNVEILPGGLIVGAYPREAAEAHLIAAQAADYLLNIKGITASFVFCPYPGGVLVSARSLGKIDVRIILAELGGGGHRLGAGAKLPGSSLKSARDRLKRVLVDFMKGGKRYGSNPQGECEELGEDGRQGESE